MQHSFKHIHASMLKLLNQQALSFDVPAINLDAIADMDMLPSSDFLGLSSLSVVESDLGEAVSGHFVVVTESDPNNMRLTERVSVLYDLCKLEMTWDLVNVDSGERLGFITIIEGAEVQPVTHPSDTSSAQAITFTGMSILSLSQE